MLDVVVQRMQIAEGLARNLERLGLARVARQVDLAAQLAALHRSEEREISPGGKKSVESAESPLGQSLAGDSLSAESAESAERVLPLAREQEKP